MHLLIKNKVNRNPLRYDSEGNELWDNIWGGPAFDYGSGVTIFANESYMTGQTEYYGAEWYDAFLIKYDEDGLQVWNTTWGGTGGESGESIVPSDRGVTITGFTTSFGEGYNDVFLTEFALNGTQLTNATWGTELYELPNDLCIDGYYVYICGKGTRVGTSWTPFLVQFAFEEPTYYSLAVTTEGSGLTEPSGILEYSNYTKVTVESIPATGYVLDYWKLDGVNVGSGISYVTTMDTNHTLTAVFSKINQESILIQGLDDEITYGGAFTNGEFFFTGFQGVYGSYSSDAFLLRLDSSGEVIDNVTWGGPEYDVGTDVAVGNDSVYMVGTTMSYGAGSSDSFIVKFDMDLNILWNTTWGGNLSDYRNVEISINGDYIYIAGCTTSFGSGQMDAFLVKYDKNGIQIWNNTWGGAYWDSLQGLATYDEYIYLTGQTSSFEPIGGEDVFLVKYDLDGNQIWNVTWTVEGRDYPSGIDVSEDAVYVCGDTHGSSVIYDVFLTKIDHSGKVLHTSTVGSKFSDYGEDVTCTDDGLFVVGSRSLLTDSAGRRPLDTLLVKFDLNCTPLYQTFWGDWNDDEEAAKVFVNGSDVYIFGTVHDYLGYGAYSSDVYLLESTFKKCDITISTDGSGTTFPTPRNYSRYQDSEMIINAVPDAGWRFDHWELDGFDLGSDASLRITVESNHSVIAFFTQDHMVEPRSWNHTWGGEEVDVSEGIASTGNYTYIVGSTISYSPGKSSAFVSKYNHEGYLIWNVTWEGQYGWAEGQDIIVLGEHIYITGTTYFPIWGYPYYGAFVAKLDTEGNFLWTKTLETLKNGTRIQTDGVSIDSDGTCIYISGNQWRSYIGYFYRWPQECEVFSAKYDTDGNIQWISTWGDEEQNLAYDLSISGNNVYVVGRASPNKGLLLQWNSSGVLQWNDTIGSAQGYGVVATGDEIFIVGMIRTQNDYMDVLLAKYNTLGTQIWNRTWGGLYYDAGTKIALVGNRILVGGKTASLGEMSTAFHLLIQSYDLHGTLQWSTDLLTRGEVNDIGNISEDIVFTSGIGGDVFLRRIDLTKIEINKLVINISGLGEIIPSQGTHHYINDTAVVLDIFPSFGWKHSKTIIDGSETQIGTPMIITMDTNHSIDVILEPYPMPIWNITWSGPRSAEGWGVVEWNGYIFLATEAYSNDTSSSDVFLTKYDPYGNQLWNTSWGGSGGESVHELVQNGTDLYIVGSTSSFGVIGDALLLKYDVEGNLEWNITWGKPSSGPWYIYEHGRGVVAVGDAVYMVGESLNTPYLIKISPEGNQVWNKSIGEIDGQVEGITTDGVYLYIVGSENPGYPNPYEPFLAKYDLDGNEIFYTTWSEFDTSIFGKDVEVDDTDVYLVAHSGYTKSYLVKFDLAGNYIWNTECSGNLANNVGTNNGSVYVVGYINSRTRSSSSQRDAFIEWYDDNGNSTDYIQWGGENSDEFTRLAVTEKYIYVTGYTDYYSDAVLLKYLRIISENSPPSSPTVVYPMNGSSETPLSPILQWSCADPDNHSLIYYVYFGLEKSPNVIIQGYKFSSYDPGLLQPNSTYYWKIVASDGINRTSSDVWNFTTTSESEFTKLMLTAGWNMVSLPVVPEDPSAAAVMDGVDFYQLVTWSGTGYATATEFEAGRGYWLLVLGDTNVTITGTPVESLNLTLSPGWSMIGGPNTGVPAVDVFPGFYQLVTWTGTGYAPATVFEPGKGFWALVLEETQIQLPPT